jgi:CDP-glycerol glycerophosphotransferase (TagB/SpsB family)
MLKTFKYILQANEFLRLPKPMRQIVFYSEGKNYWPLFEGLINGILNQSNLSICYITSDKDDPGYEFIDNRFNSFLIDDSYVRNWLFENMRADILIMTMPDLNNYQVKKSKYSVHYIYIQHNLLSLHMAYRHGAFDFFDTIFCAGPHHVKEVRHLEQKYNLPKKEILKHGCARLDSIINSKFQIKRKNDCKCALFAPSWGNNAAIELGLGDKVVKKLLSFGYKVILRPHPETFKSSPSIIHKIVNNYIDNKMFRYEENVGSLESFYESDFMITDWSGAALEYSLGLNKPVVFLDLPKKINNPFYADLELPPLEVSIREKIGIVANIDDITASLVNSLPYGKVDPKKYVFNVGNSDFYGVQYILDLAKSTNDTKSSENLS